jgi:xanthine/uracil permease
MADQAPSTHAGRTTRWGILLAFAVALLVAGCVLFVKLVLFKHVWQNLASKQRISDPSVVIGTFITLYGLFIAVFGIVIGIVTKRRCEKERWEILRVAAIALLAMALLMDLWRVLDSTTDLFTSATSGLSYRALKDDIKDFEIYFFINVAVVIFNIAASVLPGPAE